MKQPMKKGSFVPKNVCHAGVGWCHIGVGWVMQWWGVSCRGGWGCHVGVGGSYRGWVGHAVVGWVM